MDGAELVGFAPLLVDGDTLSLMGDPDLFDYQDVALLSGREDELAAALIGFLTAGWRGAAEWRRFELASVPSDSPAAAALAGAGAAWGLEPEFSEATAAPAADLPETWEEFVASLAKKHRHELRRKIRRLEAAGEVRQVTVTGPDGLDSAMEDFLWLMRGTGPDKEAFLTPDRRRFFGLLAAAAASRGVLRLSFLELDGVRVAGCLVFDFAGTHMLYNSGYDPAMSALSVGLVNKAYAIRDAIGLGARRFDFLKGAERYKYGLGGVDRAISRLVLTRH